jgi:hypothetical protein
MKRREFLKLSTCAALSVVHREGNALNADDVRPASEPAFYVSSSGSDNNPGTLKLPFATLHRAQEAVRQSRNRSHPLTVLVREGTYYLDHPLAFSSQDSGTKQAPIVYAAFPEEHVTVSGGRKLACKWTPYQKGIMMASVPTEIVFTQLFVNGKRQIRSRYPNYDASNPGKSGYLEAAGPIPAETANPFAGPDEDMTFSTQAPRGIRFNPETFTKTLRRIPFGSARAVSRSAPSGATTRLF